MEENNLKADSLKNDGYKIADKGVRLVNYLIDLFCIMILFVINAIFFDLILDIVPDDDSPWVGLYSAFIYISYYTFLEYVNGKTVGKLITKTHVIKNDGTKPEFMKLVFRSVCRIIPFDNISFLFSGNGLHDSWSKTKVVYDMR